MSRFTSSSRAQADLAARMAIEPASEVELEQGHLHRTARRSGQPNDLVDRHRRRTEEVFHQAERVMTVQLLGRRLEPYRRRANLARERPDGFDDVGGILNKRRAVADQLIAALRT